MATPTARPCATCPRPTSLAAMPDLDERLALAERTLTALVADAELPPKIGVHPRPAGSFAHAMPALPARRRPGRPRRPARDEMGRRLRHEQRARACRRSTPSVVLNDAATGVPMRHPRRRADHRAADRGRVGRRDPPVRAGRHGPRAAGGAHRRRGPGSQPPGGPRAGCCPACRWRCSTGTPSAPRRSPRPRGRPTGIGDGHGRARRARRRSRDADVVVTAASFGRSAR